VVVWRYVENSVMSKFNVPKMNGFVVDTLNQRLIIYGNEIKVFDAVSILFL
jgi:hypothetical protein